MRRRQLLSLALAVPALAGAGALAVSGRARAIGPRSEVSVGRLRHAGTWDTRPEAVRRMLWEVGKRTSIQVARDAAIVSLATGSAEGSELFFQPLLVLTGEGPLPPFDAKERARLERHLRFGGTLLVDAPNASDPFWESAQKEVSAVLAGATVRPLEAEHVVYKSFYLLDAAVGRTKDDKHLYGIQLPNETGAGRAAVILSSNDLLGALERDRFGTWRFDCEPDGESQRELAFRLATNVLMYATCLDYKADQVHIPFIMKKKRR